MNAPTPARPRTGSGTAKAGSHSSPAMKEQPLAPVASSSFYGSNSRPPLQAIRTSETRDRRRSADSSHAMEIDIQPSETADPPVVGIDLDADDTQFPPSPPSLDDNGQFAATVHYPITETMQLEGHGYLPNAILGHSNHPAFRFGSAFEWPETFNVNSLVDYELNTAYVPRPSGSRAVQTGSQAPNSPVRLPNSPPVRSYSQALGSGTSAVASAASEGSSSTPGTQPVRQNSASVSSPSKQKQTINPFSNASLAQARPHPHAYYSVSDQAWTVITPIPKDIAKESVIYPVAGECKTLRNRGIRKTHHYVRVPHGIDPRLILRPSQEESALALGTRQDIRSEPVLGGPSSASFPDPMDLYHACWAGPPTPPRDCWDLFVCSGCRTTFAVSPPNVIPSVLGSSLCQSFVKARIEEEEQKPQPQRNPTVILSALEYIWKVLRNVLYDSNSLGIPTLGSTFTKRLGKSPLAITLFERLRFSTGISKDGKAILEPPPLSPSVVLILSRAFVELSLWIASLQTVPAPSPGSEVMDLIKPKSFEKSLEQMTGPDIVGKYVPSDTDFKNAGGFARVYQTLGVTPETADEDIAFAYNCQLETDSRHQLYYLDALVEVASLRGDHRESLQVLIATERSQDRYGYSEVVQALARLRLQPFHQPGQSFFSYPISDWPHEDTIASAYQDSKEDVPKQQGSESDLKELKDAVTLLAKVTRSDLLQAVVESASPAKPSVGDMTVDEAFTYLQMSKDLNDNLLCSAVSIMFLTEDTASDFQKEKARAALGIIGDDRKSDGIKQFLQNGILPEVVEAPREAPVSVDRPAGLQNIGNTCYLNSLLQYFFTIKGLRDVVLDFDKYQETRPFEEIETSKRVGGRHVTRREIERSTKFTKLLSQLFYELIHEKAASVRPTRDLAYLALVSSKDEETASLPPAEQPTTSGEETKENGNGAETKVDSEAAMPFINQVTASAAEGEGLAAAQSANNASRDQKLGSPSVLGKRTSDHFDEDTGQMDIDTDGPAAKTSSPEPIEKSEQTSRDRSGDATGMVAQNGEDGVVEIVAEYQARKASLPQGEEPKARSPPPLPPRTASTTIAETNMMFGRQNDVSEAMDNVLFQIESAIDDSKISRQSNPPTLGGQPCSFVQSLFYGTTLQTLELETEEDAKRVKEETFGYQLVDVAKDGNDLYDGLDAAFAPSIVDIEGKKAKRQDVLTQLPPILQIQLQRVQFDRATSRVYKSNAYMPFPQTLRMGKYLSPEGRSPEFAAKQSRSSQLRSELTKLQAKLLRLEQKDEDQQTLPDILNTAADSLRQLSQTESTEEDTFMQEFRQAVGDGDDNVLALLSQHAGAIDKDILEVKQRLDACRREVEEIWSDDIENEYELSSVFIHLGAAGYGHYYLYQRALPYQPERWLKFNDESVTDVQVSEVFADTTGSTANPYWLTYVRKSEIPQRIDAVCRNFV